MNRTQDNKRPIEQIFVAKASVNSAHAGGESLIDSSTGRVDLVDGEIKILSHGGYGTRASNATIAAGDTVTASPEIFIVQGTPAASDPSYKNPSPLPTKPYEKSEPILGNSRIIYTYKAAARPTFDTWLIGNTVGSADAINVVDEANYALKISFFGREFDQVYSGTHPISMTPSYKSKDYTALSFSAAEATDDILQNLAYVVNKNSNALQFTKGFSPKKPIIAFAVDTTGTYGINPTTVKAGESIPVVNSNIGLKSFVFSKEMAASFKNAGWPAGATIIPIDLTKSGDVAAGTALTNPSGGTISAGYKGVLTLSGQPGNTETVTVGTKVYTFQTTLTNVNGNVKIGGSVSESIDNLIAAINLDSSLAGTGYAAAMTAQPESIRAQAGPGNTMVVRGSAASTSTETLTNGSWGAATLAAATVLSGKADALVLVALDRDLVYEDRVRQVKSRIDVGLFDGFNYNTVKNSRIQYSYEGDGTGRQWKMYYKDTAGQRKYSAYRGFEAMKIEYPIPVDENTYYDAVIVEHYHADLIGTDSIIKPFKAIVLIPNVDANGVLTPDSGTKSLVTTVLLPWINSTNNPVVSILG